MALTYLNSKMIEEPATLDQLYVTSLTALSTTIQNTLTNDLTSFNVTDSSVISVNSVNDALRITQAGTGNALVVEDSVNPDSTPFVVNQLGQIISGATAAFDNNAGLQITSDSSSAPNGSLTVRRCSSAGATETVSVRLMRTRGTGSTPTIVQDGDQIGRIMFLGYNGTGYETAANITAFIDGTPGSSSDMPGRLTFSTTTDGAGTVTERMRIDSQGRIGIGTTAPNELLTVAGNISATGLRTDSISSTNLVVTNSLTVLSATTLVTQTVVVPTSVVNLTATNITVNERINFNNTQNSIIIGTNALAAATSTAFENLAIGVRALSSCTTGDYNLAIGNQALAQNTTGLYNTAIGWRSLSNGISGTGNTAVGVQSLAVNKGDYNSALGVNTLLNNTDGSNNVAIGISALLNNTTGSSNVGVGLNSLYSNLTGNFNTAVGQSTLGFNTVGSNNAALGSGALLYNTTGSNNTGIGSGSLISNTEGDSNTAVGLNTLYFNTTGSFNTAVGRAAVRENTTGTYNTGVGINSLRTNTTGSYNTGIGTSTLFSNITGGFNTALGTQALAYTTTGSDLTACDNCTGVGYDARVSGNNQLQLGNSLTTTYAYGAVQNRSDERDKADIRDTVLGLEFIEQLRPVDFKWDYREDYFEKVTVTETIVDPETGNTTTQEIIKLQPIPKDGSKKRTRYHHGLVAQQVKEVMDDLSVDFGGYQNHTVKGGSDVLSVGYTELIAPLIKAVQELSARVKELENNL